METYICFTQSSGLSKGYQNLVNRVPPKEYPKRCKDLSEACIEITGCSGAAQ